MKTSSKREIALSIKLLVAASLTWPWSQATAAPIYWDGVGGATVDVWGAVENWSSVQGGGTNPTAIPGTTDVATFSATSVTAVQTVKLNANRSVSGVEFSSVATATTLVGGGTARVLTLGAGGLLKSNTGAATIGSATATDNVSISMSAAQTWANNDAIAAGTASLTVVNGVSFSTAGAKTLTLDGTSLANSTISGILANGTGTMSIAKTGAGLWLLGGANTFTGGTTVSAGTLRGTVAGAFGTGGVTLAGGTLDLRNDTGTTFTGTNTVLTADSTVSPNRATAAATSTAHTLGTLSIGANTLTVARGAGITGAGIGTINFGTTTLTNNAIFAPQASTVLTVGAINGPGLGLTQNGPGNMTITGPGAYDAGVTIAKGILQANNNTALGSGAVTFPAAGTGRLAVNAGVNVANPINVLPGITGTSGVGLIVQTGTGQSTVSGPITLSGITSAGGTFSGSNTVGNELIIAGPINQAGTNTGGVHRVGRVIYAGGGNLSGAFGVTDTVIVGATNGVPPLVTMTLGTSGSAGLDLASQGVAGYDQTLGALVLGNTTAANQYVATINLGARTLTLNGNLTSQSGTTQTVSHNINSTGGQLVFNSATNRNITVADTVSTEDLVVAGATIGGVGAVTKEGAGALVLRNVTATVPLIINAGTLAVSAAAAPATGTLTAPALSFGDAPTTLRLKLGATSDVINGGTVTVGTGLITVQPLQNGGLLGTGTYPLINYTGATPGLSQFTLSPMGRASATLVDTGSAIALQVTANEGVRWNGSVDGIWNIASTINWKTDGGADAAYLEGDSVSFVDSPSGPGGSSVTLATNVNPANVSFNNSTITTYSISAATAVGIAGPTNLSKTGDGTVVLQTANSYTGSTFVDQGVLELDHDAINNVVLSGTSGVFLNTAGTLRLTRDDGAFTFNRALTGDGTLELNAHATTGTAALAITLNGANNNFSGTVKLLAPAAATYRVAPSGPAALGTAAIDVKSGAQLFLAANVYTNNISIVGTGYADTNGNIGALRMEGSTWAGNIVVDAAGARIGAHGGTGIVSGNISGGNLSVNATNYNTTSYTSIFTGTNSYGTTTIGGAATAGTGTNTMRLNIGANGTTGTLGTGAVTINGDGMNGILGFDRSDGYTLQQTITGGGSNLARTFIDFDTLGAGFNTNAFSVTLGTAASTTTGGQLRVGQARAGAILNVDSSMTGGIFRNGSIVLGTTNLNAGAVLNVATINTTLAAAATGSVLNIKSGATLNANYFTVGEIANGGGVVNQDSGSTVNVISQLRVGHFSTETSVYNMNGGSINLTGDNSLNSPSTGAGGGASANGDNNLNTLATATIVGGGIYIGIDGTGIFNQSSGTVSTNWVVLDNRTDTLAGANMPTGIDQYNLSGGTLNLKSTYGLIQRNASAEFNVSGGTIRVENTGTGTGTGANLNIPLDAPINSSGSITLDTNGAGNAFTLSKNINGTAVITTTGDGSINLNPNAATGTGTQVITATLAGTNPVVKAGAGTTTLVNAQTYTGPTTVSAGRLSLPSSVATSSITVADGATISGEPSVAAATLGSVTGSTLIVDPNSAGAFTATALTLNGNTLVDFTAAPDLGVTSITLLNYTTKTGSGTISLANARPGSVITDTGSSFVLTFTRADLVWSGATAEWDVGTTANWNTNADKFYAFDNASFDDTGVTTAVTLTGTINPSILVVNTNTNAYTLTGVISGATTVDKSGTTNLTLAGANTFFGPVSISGGSITIPTTNGLGDASSTNKLTMDGGKLISTATMNLGANRSITVGGNGATFSSGGTAAAYTVTVPGIITGSGNLNFTSGNTTAPTFALTGSLAGFTGNMNVDSLGATTGASTLNLGAATNYAAGTITLTQGLVNGGATGLVLNGQALPAAVNVVMNSATSGTNSYRSQIVSGVAGSTINGPVSLNGTNIIQMSSNATNGITFNGPISAGGGGYTGTMFIRGTGTGIINSVITMPNGILAKTDAATWTINSTGNSWVTTSVLSSGSVKLGIDNALPITATLNIGQGSDAANSLLDLNGFNQEVPSMTYTAGNGNSTRGVGNTSATLSTLTVNNASANTFGTTTGITGGVLQGNLALLKKGAGTLTLGAVNTFTGPVTVNEGILEANASSGGLGNFTTAGRTLTANVGTAISLLAPNVLGTGIGNANLPTTVINGGTLTTTRYNVLGPVVLNGGLLTSAHASNDSVTQQSWQLKGIVTVGGAAPSSITGAGDFPGVHLDTNTLFNVADVTVSSGVDLTVGTSLLNQSSVFASLPGGLTKTGLGTMQITGTGSFTGVTNVSNGTLLLENDYASPVVVGAAGTIGGNGQLQSTLSAAADGGVVAPGDTVGTLGVTGAAAITNGAKLSVDIDDTTVLKTDKLAATADLDITGGKLLVNVTGAAAQTAYIIASYGTLTGTFASATGVPAGYTVNYAYNDGVSSNNIALVKSSSPYNTWATSFGLDPLTDGAPNVDKDQDGLANILEFVFGTNPKDVNTGEQFPTVVADGNNLIFTFRRTDTSAYLNPVVQKSTDLTTGTWSTITSGITVTDDGFGVGIDKIEVTLPMTPNVREFLRVSVTIP